MNKLGIIVVYYLNDTDIDILDLHLQSITKHTKSEYTIYGVANRVSEVVKNHLKEYKNLELISVENFQGTGSEEHSFYLDKLINHAIDFDHVTHICTLDCDSFPIKEHWEQTLYNQLSDEFPVIAISRKENGDKFLPHPSMTFFPENSINKIISNFFHLKKKFKSQNFRNFY